MGLFIFQSFTEIEFHLSEGLSWYFLILEFETTLEDNLQKDYGAQ